MYLQQGQTALDPVRAAARNCFHRSRWSLPNNQQRVFRQSNKTKEGLFDVAQTNQKANRKIAGN